MRVGYISELNLRGMDTRFLDTVDNLVSTAVNENLSVLVVSGGISNNYETTLSFVKEIGTQLKRHGIQFRFIAGNTDFYYKEAVVDKEKKFREILSLYRSCEYYLPYNPIITRRVRIIGAETWYDYSLYRGKPRDLKDITKKKILWYRNLDNDYITNESDYILGLDNIFDKRYSNECISLMANRLESYIHKHGVCDYSIVVTYFVSSKIFLKDSYIGRYKGTFEGSLKYFEVMKRFRVTDNVFGKSSIIDNVVYDGIKFMSSSGKVRVAEYD